MKITNIHNLPEPIVRAVTPSQRPQDRREGADISVTELIGPPLVKRLRDIYWDFLEDDASERLWMLLGTTVHQIMHNNSRDLLSERSLIIERHGWTIRGQFDLVDDNRPIVTTDASGTSTLSDYKVTSVWSVIFGDQEEDREAQLNLYRLMVQERLGIKISRLQNNLFFRDWRRSEAQRDPEAYPERSMMVVERPIWPDERIEAYIRGRLHEHGKSDPVCSPKDRCHRGDSWAVMKTGAKRAVRVWNTEAEAAKFVEDFSAQHAGAYSIEKREGVSARCLRFCPVWSVCPVGQKIRLGEAAMEEP